MATQLIGDASTGRSTDIPSARRVFGRSNNSPSTRNGSTRGASAQPSKPDSMIAQRMVPTVSSPYRYAPQRWPRQSMTAEAISAMPAIT
jgi:hypothetical protein